MTKYQLKQQIKIINEEIKHLKFLTRDPSTIGTSRRTLAQAELHQARLYVRGLYLAYAYVRGKPINTVETSPLDPSSNFTDYMIVFHAKSKLGLTQRKEKPFDSGHKRIFYNMIPYEKFDLWVTGQKGIKFGYFSRRYKSPWIQYIYRTLPVIIY